MKNFNGKILFLDRSDINTDEIIPARYLTESTKIALKPYCLEDLSLAGFDPKADVEGKSAIITRANFGCGSSREHAPWVLECNDINLVLAKREQMGYNKPIPVQFFIFLKSVVLHWDWGVGEQMYIAQDVWGVLMQKLPYTVLVNLYSILLAIPLGLAFGVYAALKKNKWQDHVISTAVMLFISVPSYVYAFLVQYLLCFKLKLFPLVISRVTWGSSLQGPCRRQVRP